MHFTHKPLNLLGPAAVLIALAAAGPARSEDVRVTVLAILATTDKDVPVAKELVAVAAAVQQSAPQLTGFQVGRVSSEAVAVGQEKSFPLVDGEAATVTILQGKDKKDMVRVRVKPPGLNEVTMNCCCGKFVPFVTTYETKDKKERLIIAVMFNLCQGK